jgi:hypothetical protein
MLDGEFAPEGKATWNTEHLNVTLESRANNFLDYPHQGRRMSLDTTAWLQNPVILRRSKLSIQANTRQSSLVGDVGWITTDDGRTASTGSLSLEWIPWEDVIRFGGAMTAVSSADARLFPTRINALAVLTFTLPQDLLNRILKRRTRARPFVSGTASYISNEFAMWADPRFADLTPFPDPSSGTRAATAWVNGGAGLKVANFELRLSIYNALGATIQNSPSYLPQPNVGTSSFKHYSLSWRFLPQAK